MPNELWARLSIGPTKWVRTEIVVEADIEVAVAAIAGKVAVSVAVVAAVVVVAAAAAVAKSVAPEAMSVAWAALSVVVEASGHLRLADARPMSVIRQCWPIPVQEQQHRRHYWTLMMQTAMTTQSMRSQLQSVNARATAN